jgi:putative flippase GtrA
VVGLAATFLHVCLALFFLQVVSFGLLFSNLGAFFLAVFVSYCGNSKWSFERAIGVLSAKRFFILAVLNISVIAAVSKLVELYDYPSYCGVIVVAVLIPLVGFVAQKFWVFK